MIDQKIIQRQLEHYWALYLAKTLSKGDIVALFLILYDQLFPVDNWLQVSPKKKNTTKPLNSLFYPKQTTELASHPFFKKNSPLQSLGDIINQSQFKKETQRSTLGLVHIYTQPETVQILDYVPTPMQLLEMQSQGFRCVSLLRTENWFSTVFDHKRNLRDFVIHDLEHIWQMFENPELTIAQIEFSRRLLNLIQSGRFDFLRRDPHFSNEFDYIISDMNTHPAHSYVTLKSLLMRQKTSSDSEIFDIMHHFDSLVGLYPQHSVP